MRRGGKGEAIGRAGMVMLALAGALTACQSPQDRAVAQARTLVKDGTAKRLLQAYFDHHPQCTRLPVDIGLHQPVQDAQPGTKALLAAGVLVTTPVPGRPGVVGLAAAPAERRWFVFDARNPNEPELLCFGYRKVTHVYVDEVESPGTIRYVFQLFRPAPWVTSAPLRETRPALGNAFGHDFVGADPVRIADGKLDDSTLLPTDNDPLFIEVGINLTGPITGPLEIPH